MIKEVIMYSPLSKILKDYKEGKIDHWKAHDKILLLSNVVGQSEQLCQCEDAPIKHFAKNWCDACQKHIV